MQEEWRHTSSLMALIANCHADKSSRRYRPDDFNPHATTSGGRGLPITPDNLHVIGAALCKPRKAVVV